MVTETFRWRGGWARIAPWPGPERGVAHLTVGSDTPPSCEVVEHCLTRLRHAGYGGVVTNALTAADSLPFVDAGFAVRERLHLLEHDLTGLREPLRPTRRARRGDRPGVLALDHRAFEPSWRLAGATGLDEALRATRVARMRVAAANGAAPVAYAITGRAGDQGYLQRVAVDPDARRAGWGRALVADGLHWLRRRGSRRALVNTQLGNDAALSLYEASGFRRLPVGLCVLARPL
ncbi:MAG TPA: GNAT family N-acetyltransferase [Acidimicrobiia bacterium]